MRAIYCGMAAAALVGACGAPPQPAQQAPQPIQAAPSGDQGMTLDDVVKLIVGKPEMMGGTATGDAQSDPQTRGVLGDSPPRHLE
jgi:hypothetical protein